MDHRTYKHKIHGHTVVAFVATEPGTAKQGGGREALSVSYEPGDVVAVGGNENGVFKPDFWSENYEAVS